MTATTATATATATAPVDKTKWRQLKEIENYMKDMCEREMLNDDEINNIFIYYRTLPYLHFTHSYYGELYCAFDRVMYRVKDMFSKIFDKMASILSFESNYHSALIIWYKLDQDFEFDVMNGHLRIDAQKAEEYCDVIKYIIADYRDMYEKIRHHPAIHFVRASLLDCIDLYDLYSIHNDVIWSLYGRNEKKKIKNDLRIEARRETLIDYCSEVIERERAWRRRRIVILS